jgi:hypothetical protein
VRTVHAEKSVATIGELDRQEIFAENARSNGRAVRLEL